jgi:hypothetical protein
MADSSDIFKSSEPTIHHIEITNDTITGRAGLSLFVRYLRGIDLAPHLERLFSSMRRSRKGLPITAIFKQLLCFFVDGTSHHLVHFDDLKQDNGYAAAIETHHDTMASSHTIKRFFASFSMYRIYLFRRLLQQLFLWRLRVEEPEMIMLGIDAMPMDNTQAMRREGVEPTYKRGVAGFAPLQMMWGPYLIDAVFRGGSKHSNHGETVPHMVEHVVRLIWKRYRKDVPIIIRLDSGFFDQKLFRLFDELGIGFICSGSLFKDVKEYVAANDPGAWHRYENDHQIWEYLELGDRRRTWKTFRRAFYTRPLCEERQLLMEFARPDKMLYTNLGQGGYIDDLLDEAGLEYMKEAGQIIAAYHDRGCDELVHRALKEFGTEQLPFKRFRANAAFYYIMLLSFFLYEAFKRDVCESVVPITCYPTRLRRTVIDNAGKIVRKSGRIILKVNKATWNRLNIEHLWHSSGSPPRFAWVS